MSEEPPVFDQVAEKVDRESEFSDSQREELKDFFLKHYDEIDFQSSDIRLDRMAVEHFRTINKREVDFDKRSTILYGENSQGKTSLVKSVLFNIAGLPENNDFEMTNLIQFGYSGLSTTGYWTINDEPYTLERSLRQSGQGSALSMADKPYLSEGHTTDASITSKYTDPSEVRERFGLQDLRTRGHDPYEVLTIFFLMSEDFTRFLGSSHSELMDLLFGINITTVISVIEDKIDEIDTQIKNYELNESGESLLQESLGYGSKQDDLEHHLEIKKDLRQSIVDTLKAKRGQLESLNATLAGEEIPHGLKSRRDELRAEIADLRYDRKEVYEKLTSVKRVIERYEDTEMLDDLEGIGDELRNFMTIPNRCPICTNSVDKEQRQRLLDEKDCPLCAKDMPEDRYRKEAEHVETESITDTSAQKHQEELEELQEEKQELEREKRSIETRLEEAEAEFETVKQRIEENEITDVVEEQEELQREVRNLQDRVVDVDVEIDSLETELRRVKKEKLGVRHIRDIVASKEDKRDAYKRFRDIVEKSRKAQREDLKQDLAETMESFLKDFNHGTLESAYEIRFKSGGSYHFDIHTEERILDSSVADESTAEINLHALLFHTAVLKQLSKSFNSPPIRLFTIDSPFANEVDENNAKAISNFLIRLPDILPEYQIILASAETDSFEPDEYQDSYQMLQFH
ncbi:MULTISPECIES: hypothetical protein [Halorussus]|uniref:hypothetical protein n=1 Tax=Halorussus TaxID=1070314 RepID=UPI0013B3EFC7|nr:MULTISPECIES: hypothetical protein [Halorussus]NHN59803.1 hypothetical protein [Halorussus sp. JP-T4]